MSRRPLPAPFEHPSAVVALEARYGVTVDPGPAIRLPAEVLWAFSLNEGDLLLCDHTAGSLTFSSYARTVRTITETITDPWPWLEREVFGKPMEAVGPDGRVPLPERFTERLDLRPGDRLRLEARVNGRERSLSLGREVA